ncbi:MAG: hypothetical protein WC533_04305 [Candidatus Pacearchaeota archaeon]
MNKKGSGDNIYAEIIFLILTAIFLIGMFAFVHVKTSGSAYYEQMYSKKIALLIDSSKPETKIALNVKEFEKFEEDVRLEEILDVSNQKVTVKLDSRSDGYVFPIVSTNKVDYQFSESDSGLMLNILILDEDNNEQKS